MKMLKLIYVIVNNIITKFNINKLGVRNVKYFSYLTIIMCLIINCRIPVIYAADKQVENRFMARIAIVDIQTVLEYSLAIQSIRNTIDQMSKKIQQDMSKNEIELKKIEEALIAKRPSLSEEEFEQEVNNFNKKVSLIQTEMQRRKVALEHAHAQAIGKVQETTINVISDVSTKYNIDLVIPNTQVLFAQNALNITLEIIAELNDRLKSVKIQLN
jgi:Skp family chaperone for outer membrane proteins